MKFNLLGKNSDSYINTLRELGNYYRVDGKKPTESEKKINGGFMVVEPKFLDWIDGDATILEQEPMKKAAAQTELNAYEHDGFWQSMDKLHDKHLLEKIWAEGNAPWKKW